MAYPNLWYCRQKTANRLRSCIVRLDITESLIDQHAEVRAMAIARSIYPFDRDLPIEVSAIGGMHPNGGSWHLENLTFKEADPGPAGGPLR